MTSYDMWNLIINDTDELTKQKETHRLKEQTYDCWWEGWWGRIIREFGMGINTLLYLKWITNKCIL